jgi:hypothetical protein
MLDFYRPFVFQVSLSSQDYTPYNFHQFIAIFYDRLELIFCEVPRFFHKFKPIKGFITFFLGNSELMDKISPDSALVDYRTLAPIEVPDLSNCLVSTNS